MRIENVGRLLSLAGRVMGQEWDLDSVAHWRMAVLASGLGTLRVRRAQGRLVLDGAAAGHHGLSSTAAVELALTDWLALISESDYLRAHAVIEAVGVYGTAQNLTARLKRLSALPPTMLEFAFLLDQGTGDIVGTCRDVTEAHGIEDVRRSKIAAERANQAKSEFMSQVSHELRTPLNAILGFAQLIATDNDEPLVGRQHERLQILHQSGVRLLALVDQLLQIGRIEQGKLALAPRAVNVFSIVRRCVDSLTPMAAEFDVAIEVDVVGADTAAVRADPNALEQVLINLVSNAIKYNRRGGRVTVRYQEGGAGELSVVDTGAGLTPSQMAQLFEPFNRIHARHGSIQGTGLGLVISRQLVAAMAGALDVFSEVGIGSQFRVTLPRARRTRARRVETLCLDQPSRWQTGDRFSRSLCRGR